MKLDLWLRTDQANGRPVHVDFAAIPSVGDIVAVGDCDSYLHDRYWRVDSINWSDRKALPRVDCVPAYPAKASDAA